MTEQTYFRIYAKPPESKTYQALDLSEGTLVKNLIYATILKQEESQRVLESLKRQNPDISFELREVK